MSKFTSIAGSEFKAGYSRSSLGTVTSSPSFLKLFPFFMLSYVALPLNNCLCSFRLEYFDEAVRDPSSQTAVPVDIHQPPAFLHKILQLSAVQLFYDSMGTAQVDNAVFLLLIPFFLSFSFFFFCFVICTPLTLQS